MERSHLWHSSFKGNLAMLDMNCAGLDDALAARRPSESVASANWLLGHLVYSRRGLLKLVGAPPEADPIWGSYRRHSDGEAGPLPFSALQAAFKATEPQLKAAFQAVPDWDAPTPHPGGGADQPLERVIAFLYMHEGYHVGQLGLIRKLLGLGGAM